MEKELISVINRHFTKECLAEMYGIYRDHILRNDEKRRKYNEIMKKFGVKYTELGPGTNRYGIKIDGVVIKIAYDIDGFRNNRIEYAASQDLYPYVAKTYECNGLMVAQEYVTVMTKPDFARFESKIKEALEFITSKYVIGDVGYILKNYINWGYRYDDGVCILDYGETYSVLPSEVACDNITSNNKICNTLLTYTTDYSQLVCPRCGYKYSHLDIRDRMEQSEEDARVEERIKQHYSFPDHNDTMVVEVEDEPVVVENDNIVEELIEERSSVYHYLFEDEELDAFDECKLQDRMHLVTLFGIPMLFTEEMISEDTKLPEGLYSIRIRHKTDDPDELGFIGNDIIMGFVGSFISTHPFVFNENLPPLELMDDDTEQKPGTLTLRDYCERMIHGKFSTPFDITYDYIYRWRNDELDEDYDEDIVEEESIPECPNVASDMEEDFEEFSYKETYFPSTSKEDDEEGDVVVIKCDIPEELDIDEDEELEDDVCCLESVFNGVEDDEADIKTASERREEDARERDLRIEEAYKLAVGIHDDDDTDDETISPLMEDYVEDDDDDEDTDEYIDYRYSDDDETSDDDMDELSEEVSEYIEDNTVGDGVIDDEEIIPSEDDDEFEELDTPEQYDEDDELSELASELAEEVSEYVEENIIDDGCDNPSDTMSAVDELRASLMSDPDYEYDEEYESDRLRTKNYKHRKNNR